MGVSTHFLPAANGESIWDAIDQVYAMGLRGFELVPDDYRHQLTEPHVPNVGVRPPDLSRDDRERMRAALSLFDTVALRAPDLDLNVASMNPGIREESQRQYLDCLDLAHELGACVVTLRRGHGSPKRVHDLTDVERHNIEFGLRAAEVAEQLNLEVALRGHRPSRLPGDPEVLDSQMREILAIDSERVGLDLDIAQAALTGPPPARWAHEFGGRIAAVHLCGVFRNWQGLVPHQPVERNNVVDYELLLGELRAQDYQGPIVGDIEGLDIEDVVSHVLAGRAILSETWGRL